MRSDIVVTKVPSETYCRCGHARPMSLLEVDIDEFTVKRYLQCHNRDCIGKLNLDYIGTFRR